MGICLLQSCVSVYVCECVCVCVCVCVCGVCVFVCMWVDVEESVSRGIGRYWSKHYDKIGLNPTNHWFQVPSLPGF